jgi:ERCC4-type nuclease
MGGHCLWVDSREREDMGGKRMEIADFEAKIKELTKVPFTVEERQLELGDFVFVDEESVPKVVIERKKFNDFQTSMRPGHMKSLRMQEQMARFKQMSMVPLRILLLQGSEFFDCSDRTLRRTLNTKIVGLMTHGIYTYMANDENDMIYFFRNIIERASSTPRGDGNNSPWNDLMIHVKKANTNTPEKYYQHCLQLVPGVSPGVARSLIQAYPTMDQLRCVLRSDGAGAITKLKFRDRAISKKVAEYLVRFHCDT